MAELIALGLLGVIVVIFLVVRALTTRSCPYCYTELPDDTCYCRLCDIEWMEQDVK